jgi:hypothetical protein
VVAQSLVWTRGGSLGRARMRARERKGKGRAWCGGRLFEAEAARQGRGSRGGHRVEGGNGEERGPWARRGTARRCGNGRQRPSRGARERCGVATSCGWPNRGGEKGLTGGPWLQCRARGTGGQVGPSGTVSGDAISIRIQKYFKWIESSPNFD